MKNFIFRMRVARHQAPPFFYAFPITVISLVVGIRSLLQGYQWGLPLTVASAAAAFICGIVLHIDSIPSPGNGEMEYYQKNRLLEGDGDGAVKVMWVLLLVSMTSCTKEYSTKVYQECLDTQVNLAAIKEYGTKEGYCKVCASEEKTWNRAITKRDSIAQVIQASKKSISWGDATTEATNQMPPEEVSLLSEAESEKFWGKIKTFALIFFIVVLFLRGV